MAFSARVVTRVAAAAVRGTSSRQFASLHRLRQALFLPRCGTLFVSRRAFEHLEDLGPTRFMNMDDEDIKRGYRRPKERGLAGQSSTSQAIEARRASWNYYRSRPRFGAHRHYAEDPTGWNRERLQQQAGGDPILAERIRQLEEEEAHDESSFDRVAHLPDAPKMPSIGGHAMVEDAQRLRHTVTGASFPLRNPPMRQRRLLQRYAEALHRCAALARSMLSGMTLHPGPSSECSSDPAAARSQLLTAVGLLHELSLGPSTPRAASTSAEKAKPDAEIHRDLYEFVREHFARVLVVKSAADARPLACVLRFAIARRDAKTAVAALSSLQCLALRPLSEHDPGDGDSDLPLDPETCDILGQSLHTILEASGRGTGAETREMDAIARSLVPYFIQQVRGALQRAAAHQTRATMALAVQRERRIGGLAPFPRGKAPPPLPETEVRYLVRAVYPAVALLSNDRVPLRNAEQRRHHLWRQLHELLHLTPNQHIPRASFIRLLPVLAADQHDVSVTTRYPPTRSELVDLPDPSGIAQRTLGVFALELVLRMRHAFALLSPSHLLAIAHFALEFDTHLVAPPPGDAFALQHAEHATRLRSTAIRWALSNLQSCFEAVTAQQWSTLIDALGARAEGGLLSRSLWATLIRSALQWLRSSKSAEAAGTPRVGFAAVPDADRAVALLCLLRPLCISGDSPVDLSSAPPTSPIHIPSSLSTTDAELICDALLLLCPDSSNIREAFHAPAGARRDRTISECHDAACREVIAVFENHGWRLGAPPGFDQLGSSRHEVGYGEFRSLLNDVALAGI